MVLGAAGAAWWYYSTNKEQAQKQDEAVEKFGRKVGWAAWSHGAGLGLCLHPSPGQRCGTGLADHACGLGGGMPRVFALEPAV